MPNLQKDLLIDPSDGDILSSYRKRIWSLFGLICVVLFLPGSVFIFINGYKALSLAALFMLVTIVLNNGAFMRKRMPDLAMALFMAALMMVTGLCIIQREVVGIFWTFPAVLFINFVTFGKLARVYTAVYFVFISTIMIWVLDVPTAARAMLGLLMTSLFTNIFLGIIDKLQKRLIAQSTVDPLTGALNRRHMDLILQEAIERKRRTLTPASILVIDIDEFKSVNDNYGHAVGDSVLTSLVSLLKARARLLDRLFRLGGEEFMLYLPDTDGLGAIILAEELRLMVSEEKFIDDRVITVSIGICELEAGETVDDWIKRGDDALFSAKNNGRNQTVEALLAEAYC